jgi:hypothetical protein
MQGVFVKVKVKWIAHSSDSGALVESISGYFIIIPTSITHSI